MTTAGRDMETRTLPYRPLFIVGLPRSGTTLVQLALSSHSSTITTRETHLFDFYLGPLIDVYDAEAQSVRSDDGIRHLLPNDAFLSAMRELAITVLNAIYQKKPTALVVIEKSPLHLFYLQAIRRCLPEVYILHVIRDPRGVIASLKAAGSKIGAIGHQSGRCLNGLQVGAPAWKKRTATPRHRVGVS